MTILVVDDAPDVIESVQLGFTLQWREVEVFGAATGEQGLDLVKGLELGADDYVTKPFHHLELLARVKAVLRRLDMPAPADRVPSFRSGELEMDFARQELRIAGKRVELTPTEYKLLYHFTRNAGYVLTHGTLLAKVWGREYVDEVDYLRVYVRRLRDKLGDHSEEPRYIRTERGPGYRFLAASGVAAGDEARWAENGPGSEAGAVGHATCVGQSRVVSGRHPRRPIAAARARTSTPSRTGEPSLIGSAVFGAPDAASCPRIAPAGKSSVCRLT